MELTSTDFGELIALGGLLIGGIGAWIKLQKDIVRMDTEITDIRRDIERDQKANTSWFEKIESKLDSIMQKLMK